MSSNWEAEWEAEIDDNTLIISEGVSGLEIVIRDFDSRRAVADTLPQGFLGGLTQLGVSYPVDGSTEPPTYLQVNITGNGEQRRARLHYGNNVSSSLPVEFAEKLQALFLVGGEVVA